MIYIIDDDKSVRRSFEILLNSAGLECKSYVGAKEFLDEYEQAASDLLILDINMPDMNGYELLKILREKKVNTHVIIVTAYDEKESRCLAKKYDVTDYLIKPVDGDSLIDLISSNIKHPNF